MVKCRCCLFSRHAETSSAPCRPCSTILTGPRMSIPPARITLQTSADMRACPGYIAQRQVRPKSDRVVLMADAFGQVRYVRAGDDDNEEIVSLKEVVWEHCRAKS